MSDERPFHNPFGALAHLRGNAPVEPPAPAPATTPEPGKSFRIARAVIRLERSGRGGKEVTAVEHLGLEPADLDTWTKAIKSQLGCGGHVEGDTIVLQGDQRKRLPDVLTARGVKKITIG